MTRRGIQRLAIGLGSIALLGVTAFFVPRWSAPIDASERAAENGGTFAARSIGRAAEGNSWITDLKIVDLDGDGLKDVLACDGRRNEIVLLRQTSSGVFEERTIGEDVSGPAHVETADMNGDGRLDVLVAAMGVIPPSNAQTGAVIVLLNEGEGRFNRRVLAEKTARVTYVAAADFNRDGMFDLIVGEFGYIQGGIRWLENRGDWKFEAHPLLDLPGTIHSPAIDLDGDGHLDVVALVAQDAEEVHAFFGDGAGRFIHRILYGSTNKDYGSSGLTIGDVNRDGRPDIVYTNGDGFDYATPGSRPWHGVQWLENLGDREFAYHRIGYFAGAYSPVVADLNDDGLPDVIASSCFNDWKDQNVASLVCFENDGRGGFRPRILGRKPTHLVVVKAADLLGDECLEMVSGGFAFYPPYDRAARITLWERKP